MPAERTPAGVPSATDFLVHDLPAIIHALASHFEDSTVVIPGVDERVLVTSGITVAFMAIYVSLSSENVVELFAVEFHQH